jgi:2-polyprenyl-6-methoxyphenol hydroxylase-like FAD-dependent oxidoreductase
MERFITTIPGEFPPPQHPKSLMITRGRCGVVLLGDAAHAFPPDLGQVRTS